MIEYGKPASSYRRHSRQQRPEEPENNHDNQPDNQVDIGHEEPQNEEQSQ